MRIRTVIILLSIGIAGVAGFRYHRAPPPPRIEEAVITRGDVIQTVKATGTLTPHVTVAVGSQVTGTIRTLAVDYNSIIKKGQLLAEIAPEPFQLSLQAAEAARLTAASTLAADKAALAEDELEAERIARLFADQQETAEDRDNAALQVETARLMLKRDADVIAVDDAGVEAAKDNLARCRIISPVDGVVMERDVEVGQTINAATASPTLYQVATDLNTLDVAGSLDEADMASVTVGEPVAVSVDAYPGQNFDGKVKQVRLNSTVVSNVVTYPAIVTVPNPQLRLLPGMTASITITVNTARDTLRVPIAALRFRYTGPIVAGPHTIYVRSADQIVPKRILVGVIDGQLAAITPAPGESLAAGDHVITDIVTPNEPRPAAGTASRNPFVAAPGRGGRGF